MKKEIDPRWSFFIGSWWFNFGWYAGEPFRLFSFSILEMLEGLGRKVETVSVLDIQFLRLAISVGFNR